MARLSPEPAAFPLSRIRRQYALAVLTTIYTLNLLDRGLIVLLLEPIKRDLHASDTQLGFLTGIAFGLFYATLGIPIARWADRGNRVNIAALAIGLWGVVVMLSVCVANFAQLIVARFAASVGEAGCVPPTYSLLGDYFPRVGERARAMAVYMIASPLSALLSFTIGGWVNQHFGWRRTFFIMGLPALAVAVLARTTLIEPRSVADQRTKAISSPRTRDVIRRLWVQASTRNLMLAIIVLFTMGLGLTPWYAAFMIRTHGIGTAELGVWLGVIFGVGGIGGTILGGAISERYFGDNPRGQMRLCAVLIALLTPATMLFLVLHQKELALLALLPVAVIWNFIFGPTFALLQRLVPDEMRATSMAVVMLFANLIGMGIGPQLIGVLSDRFAGTLGDDSLRYAMLSMSTIAVWGAFHLWRVGAAAQTQLSSDSPSLVVA